MLQPWQAGSPAAAGTAQEQIIPRALGFQLRSTARIGAAQNISQTQRERSWPNRTAVSRGWEYRENIPILSQADKAVWIQAWESSRPAGPGTASPLHGKQLVLSHGKLSSRTFRVRDARPYQTRTQLSIHVIFLVFCWLFVLLLFFFFQKQRIFIALEVGREQKLATGKA